MRRVTGDDGGGLWAGVVLLEMSWEDGRCVLGGGMAFHSNLHLVHHRALLAKKVGSICTFADEI